MLINIMIIIYFFLFKSLKLFNWIETCLILHFDREISSITLMKWKSMASFGRSPRTYRPCSLVTTQSTHSSRLNLSEVRFVCVCTFYVEYEYESMGTLYIYWLSLRSTCVMLDPRTKVPESLSHEDNSLFRGSNYWPFI